MRSAQRGWRGCARPRTAQVGWATAGRQDPPPSQPNHDPHWADLRWAGLRWAGLGLTRWARPVRLRQRAAAPTPAPVQCDASGPEWCERRGRTAVGEAHAHEDEECGHQRCGQRRAQKHPPSRQARSAPRAPPPRSPVSPIRKEWPFPFLWLADVGLEASLRWRRWDRALGEHLSNRRSLCATVGSAGAQK
jgi:hypothetical protein